MRNFRLFLIIGILLFTAYGCLGRNGDPATSDEPASAMPTAAPVTDAPAETSAPSQTEGVDIEKTVLDGTPVRIDTSALISDGIELDFDNDGVKNLIGGEPCGQEHLYTLTCDGNVGEVRFMDDDELWLISLLGDRIDIAIKDDALNYQEIYDHLKNDRGDYDSQTHPCFSIYRLDSDDHSQLYPKCIQLFVDSADSIPRLGSIEEYVSEGAICGAAFISETNEFNDLSLSVDLDGDGTKENVFIRVGHSYGYDPETHDIVKELPIVREEEQLEIKKEIEAQGLLYGEEDWLTVEINDVRYDPWEEDKPSMLYPGGNMYLAADSSGGIMLVYRDVNFITLSWREGRIVWELVESNEQ